MGLTPELIAVAFSAECDEAFRRAKGRLAEIGMKEGATVQRRGPTPADYTVTEILPGLTPDESTTVYLFGRRVGNEQGEGQDFVSSGVRNFVVTGPDAPMEYEPDEPNAGACWKRVRDLRKDPEP